MIKGGVQRAFNGARDFAHPEHHRAEDADGNQADDAFKEFLLLLREFSAHQLQAATDQQGQGCSKENPDPYRWHPLPTPGLLKVAGNNADDKRGFNALAQHDQKRNKHEESTASRISSG